MNFQLIHLYPDLMSLYGSYANVALLQRTLESMGHTVNVQKVRPGESVDLSKASFLFMGAGTERSQIAALQDLKQYSSSLKSLYESGLPMLFCGTAMELLGSSIQDTAGKEYEGLALASFRSVQKERRMVEDVYGTSTLDGSPMVGFINKSAVITGITTPLVENILLGYGNEGAKGSEGFHQNRLFASELTGPILVKNPHLLKEVICSMFAYQNLPLPEEFPKDSYLEDGYAITAKALLARAQSK